ncbi:MAG: uncharacterized protein K0R15_1556 [Clostridiales bacterium]|nr:uncharacterized protein [Clostridiales bacterium]
MNTEKVIEDKQSIKRKRIKKYFLNAAKEIIITEGVENLSVRKIADIAGYSYTTIYNYYTDLNELLREVKVIMVNDLIEHIQKKMRRITYDLINLKILLNAYMSYYFENPNVFKFFYLHRMGKMDNNLEEGESRPNYKEIWKEAFSGFAHNGIFMEKDTEVLAKIFIYSMHGMMTLSFSEKGNITQENVYEDLEKIVDYLIQKD